jgi:Nucleotidyl transferase AbiEii toxin, Type IV TA system
MEFVEGFLRLVRHLNREGVAYVLVGGAAMNVHGLVRATEDIDLFIQPTEDNIARLRAALHATWDDPAIDEITASDLCGEYPAIRYGPPKATLYLDLISRLGEATRYENLRFQTVNVRGEHVRVATPGALHRMKRNTVRPIDRADADSLQRVFNCEGDDET